MPKQREKKGRPIPTTPAGWLVEIALAWLDAGEAKHVGPMAGTRMTDARRFHVAPLIALKFRGWKLTGKKAEDICKTALANYVVNTARDASTKSVPARPKLSFALVYVAALFAMDVLDLEMAQEILAQCERNLSGSYN